MVHSLRSFPLNSFIIDIYDLYPIFIFINFPLSNTKNGVSLKVPIYLSNKQIDKFVDCIYVDIYCIINSSLTLFALTSNDQIINVL